jgi:hypothetical protein
MPALAPASGVPTPNVAAVGSGAAHPPVAVVLAWSDCVRPERVDVRAGAMVQWQALERGADHELVLEDGTTLGRIAHVLEYRVTQPWIYRYRSRALPSVGGTIVVSTD